MDWIFGLHAVQTLLKSDPARVVEIRLARSRTDQRLQKIEALAKSAGVSLQYATTSELDKLVEGRHQGVAARCKSGETYDEKFLADLVTSKGSGLLLLVLDGVTDPHNLGACLRSADGAGVDAVVVPKDRSAGLTPVVQKVACGAAESVPLVVVTNLSRTLQKLQQDGVWLVGTSGEADKFLYDQDLTGALAIVMGAEGDGMRKQTTETCDFLVKLPMLGSVESLNVSVATGVCLYEAVRQRR